MILAANQTPFAETQHLRIRGYHESDIDKLAALIDDPRTQRTGIMNVVPQQYKLKKDLPDELTKKVYIMFCILEAKEPAEDGDTWAGFMQLLNLSSPKNRNVEFGIALNAKFWGKGLGMRGPEAGSRRV
jgi:RimJ/RimL family protein N-acetyltransferase